MFYRRLDFHIFLNIVFLLALAMLLINIVLMGAAQRLQFQHKVAEGELVIRAIGQNYHRMKNDPMALEAGFIEALLKTSGYACAVISDPAFEKPYTVGETAVSDREMIHAARQAREEIEVKTRLTGATWGVFWRQKANLILSAPLYSGDTVIAGISIAFHLQRIYRQLRHVQHFVLVYILINLVLLTFIGCYRFSKSTIVPLKKLVDTAEACTEGDHMLFFGSDKEGNEFNQLSNALNQMLNRISKDQENLRLNVDSLKKANLDLKKAQNDIINAEKLASVGRLSAGIAHEIGNPIAIIIGYLELLKRKDISTSDRRDFIERTESEIHRINQIIRQLLDFSRPAHHAAGQISVHEILSDISQIFAYQPLMKHTELKLRLSAAKDTVIADAALIRQAFLNLVINAADAMNQAECPGKLVISTRNLPKDPPEAAAHLLEITFQDNGIGIPDESLDYIFEPFYTTKDPGKGTGLGLSVCYMIIEASGGKIFAESEEGAGTKMVIKLPLTPEN